jgi:hypothetical protein
MKRLLLIATLVIASCNILPADTIPAGPDSTLNALVTRVADRHDEYVSTEPGLSKASRLAFLTDSQEAREVSMMPYVQVDMLTPSLEPVMARHDQYVRDDIEDQLELDIYLESTKRLRSLIRQAESAR